MHRTIAEQAVTITRNYKDAGLLWYELYE